MKVTKIVFVACLVLGICLVANPSVAGYVSGGPQGTVFEEGTVYRMPEVTFPSGLSSPPQTFGPGITWDITHNGNLGYTGSFGGYIYDGGYVDFGLNGRWDANFPTPFADCFVYDFFMGLPMDTMTFTFDTPVRGVGGFLNYYKFGDLPPGLPLPDDFSIAVYDENHQMIEENTLNFTTGGGNDTKLFVGFEEEDRPIKYFELHGMIGITDLTVLPKQILYLDFGANYASWNPPIIPAYWKLPFSEPYPGFIKDVVELVDNTYYKDYPLEVTTQIPSFGPYSTIYIDPSPPQYTRFMGLVKSDTLGMAEEIDYGNKNHSDNALIFTDNFAKPLTVDSLAQVIAHEAAHLFGLRHVGDNTEVMYPYDSIQANKFGTSYLAHINQDTKAVEPITSWLGKLQYQDSRALLAQNLGLVSGYDPLDEQIVRYLKIYFDNLFSTLYNVEIGVLQSDSSLGAGAGPYTIDVGEITPGMELSIALPITAADAFFLTGASTPGGATDVFSVNNGLSLADFSGIYPEMGNQLTDANLNMEIQLAQQNQAGVFESYGSLGVTPPYILNEYKYNSLLPDGNSYHGVVYATDEMGYGIGWTASLPNGQGQTCNYEIYDMVPGIGSFEMQQGKVYIDAYNDATTGLVYTPLEYTQNLSSGDNYLGSELYRGGIAQMTNNSGAFDVAPQVLDDGRLLWQGWDGHDYEIYSQVPGQSPTQLTNNDSPDVMPQMNAQGQAVWMNWDGSNWQVWYNLGDGPVQFTNSTGFNVLPQITADAQIYWQGWDGHDYEIYHYNPTTQATTQLTDNEVPDAALQVNASGQLTWMELDSGNWQVCYDTGNGPVQLTTSGANQSPQITDDGQIFWQGRTDGDYEIYRYTISSGATYQFTNNTVDDITPAVKNGVLVWSQWDGSYWQIYREVLSTSLITQITNDTYDNKNPRVNANGQIVWQKWDGSDYEVYAYK